MVKNLRFQLPLFVFLCSAGLAVEAATPPAASSGAALTAAPAPLMKAGADHKTAAAALSATPTKPLPLHQTYTYQADRYRDPFVPLVGAESKADTNDHAPQITSLTLKGIVQDAGGRMAVLTSGVSSYILKGGRLYDPHNKVVRGISGVVKSNSVMLIGSDRTVKELRIVKPTTP